MIASSRFLTFYVFFSGLLPTEFFVQGDCWYDNKKHAEYAEVPTGEPCLNCTCNKSVLLCYLRVCPQLPNPPPLGCILVHRYNTCCPELICNDFYNGGTSVQARADPSTSDLDEPSDHYTAYKDACVLNGSIYSPGSAMHTSSLCEYCYCLAGKQVCVKPKCLLALEGCSPVYHDTSCCPVRYNCSRADMTTQHSISTTNFRIFPHRVEGGCIVNGTHYTEGSKVIGVGHTPCDNCYCLGNILRCEPMHCAPPLMGCTPVVKPGECCAASYNCNGTLEVKSLPNTGLFPTISKHYSKLHKHAQIKSQETAKSGIVTVAPLYVLPDSLEEPSTNMFVSQRSPELYGTTRQFFSGSRFGLSTTQEPRTSLVDQLDEGRYHLISSSNQRSNSTSKNPSLKTAVTSKFSGTPPSLSPKKDDAGDFLGSLDFTSILKSLLDRDDIEKLSPIRTSVETTTTEYPSVTATTLYTTTDQITETDSKITESMITSTVSESLVTVTEILNSTDCINGGENTLSGENEVITVPPLVDPHPMDINNLIESRTEILSTTTEESETLSTEQSYNVNVKLRNNFNKVVENKLPPNIEVLLNINKSKNGDYDYDYNEPTLPPSLPNLKIIPFLAADALDLKKETLKESIPIDKHDTGQLELGINIFKPPVKTEGGFVPKDPISDTFYDNDVVSVPSITSEAGEAIGCIKDGEEIAHGIDVLSDSPCTTCSCIYGRIVCHKIDCPPVKPKCKLDPVQSVTLCCPNYICDDVIIGQIPPEIVTVADGIIPLDPFNDVIRTEPAPNLQSLIGDMNSFFKSTTNSSDENLPVSIQDPHLDLFSDVLQTTPGKTTTSTDNYVKVDLISTSESPKEFKSDPPTTTVKISASTDQNSVGVGLLKLAGCNIYGRMYRVGRIISELSGPCLECKCTEVGVQCNELKCYDERSTSN